MENLLCARTSVAAHGGCTWESRASVEGNSPQSILGDLPAEEVAEIGLVGSVTIAINSSSSSHSQPRVLGGRVGKRGRLSSLLFVVEWHLRVYVGNNGCLNNLCNN